MDFISFRQNCGVFGEDLVTGLDAIEVQTLDANELRVDDGKVNLVPKQDAYSRSLTDLISELERRSLPVKGFFSDDVKVLQAAFDKEHEAYIETKKKELIDSKLGEAQAFAERQKEELIKASIGEEADEISRNRRIAAWFQLILNGSSPLHCRIDELTDVSVRSLSKALWNDTRLVSLDVSNMQLCDNSGAYLARVLQNNNSIQKLELAGNQFASKCCAQLALSLSANDQNNLGFLGLDSNPLATGDNGKECVMQLAEAIGKNRSLVSLGLWRCGLGIEAGRAFARAISTGNSSLISLEVGYNEFDGSDVVAIAAQLEINRKKRSSRHAKQAELHEENRKLSLKHADDEKNKGKEQWHSNWLADEQMARAEIRRAMLEDEKREHDIQEQKRQQMEHVHKLEEARVQELNKKKSKGKKGKGKKK